MDKFVASAEEIFQWLTPATWVAVAAAVIVTGLCCVVGGDEGRQKAKKALPYIAIGCILILGAVTLSKEFIGKVAF